MELVPGAYRAVLFRRSSVLCGVGTQADVRRVSPELLRQFFLGKKNVQVLLQATEFGILIYLYNITKTFDFK